MYLVDPESKKANKVGAQSTFADQSEIPLYGYSLPKISLYEVIQ